MKNNRSGTTLIEVMIAVILIAIGAITGFAFLVYCQQFAVLANSRVDAANFARRQMECIYMIDNGLGQTAPVNPDPNQLRGGAMIQTVAAGQTANTETVSVTITWNR